MRLLSAIGLLVIATTFAPGAQGQDATPKPDPAAGKALATQLCSSCHLVSPEDTGPVPDGVPSFVALAARPGTDQVILEAALLKEHPVMPQPPLTTLQAGDVIAYILSLRP